MPSAKVIGDVLEIFRMMKLKDKMCEIENQEITPLALRLRLDLAANECDSRITGAMRQYIFELILHETDKPELYERLEKAHFFGEHEK